MNMGYRHGGFGTPAYRSWGHMVGRCTCPTDRMYPDYGAKGVTVAKEWVGEGGFENFLAHIGERPSLAHRIDNSLGYAPGNVRWATSGEQARNRRSTILVTISGVTKCAKDWATQHGIDPDTAYARIKAGWDLVRAVTQPTRRARPHVAPQHEEQTS